MTAAHPRIRGRSVRGAGGRLARSGAAAALCLAWFAIASPIAASAQSAPQKRPNIIVINTDDQALSTMQEEYMPETILRIGGQGTTFNNSIVTTPLCCPSRASMLTGQYAHNHEVLRNAYGLLRDKRNVLPEWLRRAGYRTAHVGKFLNGYEAAVDDRFEVAPGWDLWFTTLGPTRYLGYEVSANGRRIRFGKGRLNYVTRILNRKALSVIRRFSPESKPLYLQLDHRAPHTETGVNSRGRCGMKAIPEKRDAKRFRGELLPTPPSFNAADVSDKPSFVRDSPALTEDRIRTIARRYECGLGALWSVDRGVKQIVEELRRLKELKHTVLVFTSDNGYFFGEHRIGRDKALPYEEGIRVPLLIRAPKRYLGTQPVAEVAEPVANIDLAPTILDLARSRPCIGGGECRVMDGRSLIPLLSGRGAWPRGRALLVEYDGSSSRGTSSCRYDGVRAQGWIYVVHLAVPSALSGRCEPTEDRELYNLLSDPFQLRNLAPGGGSMLEQLRGRLSRLRDCAGIPGRDPAPPGSSHCE